MADKTVTVKSAGGDYTSLNGAFAGEVAINPDLTAGGMDGILNIELYAKDDTDQANTGTGWTVDADHYINVYVADGEVHSGVWTGDEYNLVCTGVPLAVNESYCRFRGLQLASTQATSCNTVTLGSVTGTYFSKCIFKRSGGGSTDVGLYNSNYGIYVYVWNCLFYDYTGYAIRDNTTSGAYYNVYNCTFHSNKTNIMIGGTSASRGICKNNLIQSVLSSGTSINPAGCSSSCRNNVTDYTDYSNMCFGVTADSGTTSDASAGKLIQSGQNFTSTVKVGMFVKNTTDTTYTYVTAVDSDTQLSLANDIMANGENYTIYHNFYGAATFENEAGDDFRLDDTDTIAKDMGYDTSGDDAPMNFTDDVAGTSRPQNTYWDIGFFEVVAAGGATILPQMLQQHGG